MKNHNFEYTFSLIKWSKLTLFFRNHSIYTHLLGGKMNPKPYGLQSTPLPPQHVDHDSSLNHPSGDLHLGPEVQHMKFPVCG